MNSHVYNPAPGNPHTNGQVATPSTVRAHRGQVADSIIMPDTSPEARTAAGVRVGSLTVVRSSGFHSHMAEVLTADGQTLCGDAALWVLFEALKAEAGVRS